MAKKLILFTLQSFSTTGGVQKMARTLAHSLHQAAADLKWNFEVWSLYDQKSDLMEQYVPLENFRGFGHNRLLFSLKIIAQAYSYNVVVLTHINLALVGLVIKMINPGCKVLLVAHGIEVWRPLSTIKGSLLQKCDKIICVSRFTRQQIITLHRVDPDKCVVLNNAVDPFIKLPKQFKKPAYLLERHGLTNDDKIIFTLTRMAYTEQYKGYVQVINAIKSLKTRYPSIKYVLAGKYDEKEETRVRKLINELALDKDIILTGFVNENELTDHFLLADVFVLPSKKEGFGIVFIEALLCGLPVISGNADGSTDAIRDGQLGRSVNVDDLEELKEAMTTCLEKRLTADDRSALQRECLRHFNEQDYIQKLKSLILESTAELSRT
jgi:glycosyltransferase involved in cell wall biosynthesis